jgi:hypothetical protein
MRRRSERVVFSRAGVVSVSAQRMLNEDGYGDLDDDLRRKINYAEN